MLRNDVDLWSNDIALHASVAFGKKGTGARGSPKRTRELLGFAWVVDEVLLRN